MGLPKGRTNNLNGRKKGSKNKVTADLRAAITEFLQGNFAMVETNFKSLQPGQQIKFYIDLLGYAIPKLQNTTLQSDLDRLTDDQLQKLADQIIKNLNDHEK
jgi:hypothetical protein